MIENKCDAKIRALEQLGFNLMIETWLRLTINHNAAYLRQGALGW